MRQHAGSQKLAVLFSGMGETASTITIANRLASAGYDVLRLYPKIQFFDFDLLDTKEKWDSGELRTFVRGGALALATRYEDMHRLVERFKQMYGYSTVGVMGISLGGITAHYLSGSHPEMFQSTVGIITGGKLCEILLVSEEPRIKEISNKVFEKFTVTHDEARDILCEELQEIDPLRVADRIPAKQALLVSNIADQTIPYRFTKMLWRAAGRPAWKLMALKLPFARGHESSGFALFFPVPLFQKWGCFYLPVWPQNADSLVLRHFESTLK